MCLSTIAVIYLVAMLVDAVMVWRAPLGYEDAEGFHFGAEL